MPAFSIGTFLHKAYAIPWKAVPLAISSENPQGNFV